MNTDETRKYYQRFSDSVAEFIQKKIEVETDLGDSYTSRRIAEAMKNVFDWVKNGNA